MRILELRLENVCQHENLAAEFSPGLNAVIGSNGSGKSNVLKAIYASLTNDFSRNPGEKADNIRQAAGPREASRAVLRFSHAGAEYSILRSLRPAKQELTVPGETVLTKDRDVNDRIAKILNTSPDVLDSYVFVDQWRMFDFLDATPAVRAKAFARLFGTYSAEEAWKAVGDYVSKNQPVQAGAELDSLGAEKDLLQQSVSEVESKLKQYDDLPERPPATDPDRQALESARRRRDLEQEEGNIRREASVLLARTGGLKAELSEFETDLRSLEAAESGVQGDADQARAALAHWRNYNTVRKARERVANRLEKTRLEAATKSKPAPYGLYVSDIDPANDRLDETQKELARAKRFLLSFDPKTGRYECPECHTPVDNLKDRIEEAKRYVAEKQPEADELLRHVTASRAYDRLLGEYTRWHVDWANRMSELEKELAGLQDVAVPQATEEELRRVVVTHDEMRQTLRDLQRTVGEISREVESLEGRSAELDRRLAAVVAEKNALAVISPEGEEQVRRRADDRVRRYQERAALRGTRQSQVRQLQDVDKRIAEAERKKADSELSRRRADHFSQVRDILHRDALPRAVARHHLRRLESQTNEFLSLFDAPFRVRTDDDLSFRAMFQDGGDRPAGRLSGGQKVVLALAFRLSVNSAFAGEVGLLCLDEPTVGLDEHNLSCLEPALNRLRDLSRSRGLQVIMVTHERSLAHLFDKVIDLSPTE